MGWHLQDYMVAGVRQSINYASDAFQYDGAWAYTTGLGYNF